MAQCYIMMVAAKSKVQMLHERDFLAISLALSVNKIAAT